MPLFWMVSMFMVLWLVMIMIDFFFLIDEVKYIKEDLEFSFVKLIKYSW